MEEIERKIREKVESDRIEWNTVKYIDCMDKDEGLPSLPDKSVDLCLTDPPYNVNAKGNSQKEHNNLNWNTPDKKDYNDYIDNYLDWSINWFKEIKRICKTIIFTAGYQNITMWLNIDKFGFLFHYKPNGQGFTDNSMRNKTEIILTFGDFKKRLSSNTFEIYLRNGFLRETHYFHPHPKSKQLYNSIIKQLNPTSVIDPFLGSGTTAEVCTKLGIPWLGYEINEVYSQDINKRLKNCKKEPKQVTII